MGRVQRRQLLIATGAMFAARLVYAQQAGRVYRIGVIATEPTKFEDALFEELAARGYIQGKNLAVLRRYSGDEADRFQEFAAEMVRIQVDAIIVFTTPAALAAKKATRAIPIIIPTAIDPVRSGLVASLARPGGNVTGGAILYEELGAKRLQLLKEVVPGIVHVAVLWNAGNPANAGSWAATERIARTLGLTLRSYEVRNANDFEVAFAAIANQRPDAIHVLPDSFILHFWKQIVELMMKNRLPSVVSARESVEAGVLMSYGPDAVEMGRRGGYYVDKILNGVKPADLPMEQPTKFELTINMKTAKALGITFPPSVLVRADRVIE